MEAVAMGLPPQTANGDLKVANSSGTTTLKNAISYIPKPITFAAHGAALAQGIYDPKRDVYYFTDASSIWIFSRTNSKWLSPIPIAGTNPGSERLWGLALSHDGSQLAIADMGGGAIYVLNPDSPSNVKSFVLPASLTFGTATFPVAVAVTNSGVVYFSATAPGISGAGTFFSLNTNNSTWKNYQLNYGGDTYSRLALTADEARVYYNAGGVNFAIDTTSTDVAVAPVPVGYFYSDDLALAANQTRLASAEYFYDADFNPESFMTMNDREILSAQYVYGGKLSPDGLLYFQPSPSGIDVFDGHSGQLVDRVGLTLTLSSNYDALVADGRDNVLIAIAGDNGSGIAVLDLSSIAEPNPPAYDAHLSSRGLQSSPLPSKAASKRALMNPPPLKKFGSGNGTRRTAKFVTSTALLPARIKLSIASGAAERKP